MNKYVFMFFDGTKEVSYGENQTDAWKFIGLDMSMIGNLKSVDCTPVDCTPVEFGDLPDMVAKIRNVVGNQNEF